MTRGGGVRLALVATLVALAVAACLPSSVTSEGRDVSALYTGFFAIAIVIAAIVFGLTTFTIIRHRHRPGDALP
ncbi:MAG: hypothetical protein ACJ77B_07630, partial [Chloroflexota bacterium]